MGLKGERIGSGLQLAGALAGFLQDKLMTTMHAIKVAYCNHSCANLLGQTIAQFVI